MIRLLVFSALFAAVADAACANGCSGHGTCGDEDLCKCFPRWTSPDCSTRECPYGPSWVAQQSTAKASIGPATGVLGGRHGYTVCSSKGECNQDSGECECYSGYTGLACSRQTCPDDCSGHGRCITNKQTDASYTYANSFVSEFWDADMTRLCSCDRGWQGYACNKRICPVGADPLTCAKDKNAPTVQRITLKNMDFPFSKKTAAGGRFKVAITLTFEDMFNGVYTTQPIRMKGRSRGLANTATVSGTAHALRPCDATVHADCSQSGAWTALNQYDAVGGEPFLAGGTKALEDFDANRIRYALESLPNFAIPSVNVTDVYPLDNDNTNVADLRYGSRWYFDVTFSHAANAGAQNLMGCTISSPATDNAASSPRMGSPTIWEHTTSAASCFSCGSKNTCVPATANAACSGVVAPANQAACDPHSATGTCTGGAGCSAVSQSGPKGTCTGTMTAGGGTTPCTWTSSNLCSYTAKGFCADAAGTAASSHATMLICEAAKDCGAGTEKCVWTPTGMFRVDKLATEVGNKCVPATVNAACSGVVAPVNQAACDPHSAAGTCTGGASTECTSVGSGPKATCTGTPTTANGACVWTSSNLCSLAGASVPATCSTAANEGECNGYCTWLGDPTEAVKGGYCHPTPKSCLRDDGYGNYVCDGAMPSIDTYAVGNCAGGSLCTSVGAGPEATCTDTMTIGGGSTPCTWTSTPTIYNAKGVACSGLAKPECNGACLWNGGSCIDSISCSNDAAVALTGLSGCPTATTDLNQGIALFATSESVFSGTNAHFLDTSTEKCMGGDSQHGLCSAADTKSACNGGCEWNAAVNKCGSTDNKCVPTTANAACSGVSAPVNQAACDPHSATTGTCTGTSLCTAVSQSGPEGTCTGTMTVGGGITPCTWTSSNGCVLDVGGALNGGTCTGTALCTAVSQSGPEATCTGTMTIVAGSTPCTWTLDQKACSSVTTEATCGGNCKWRRASVSVQSAVNVDMWWGMAATFNANSDLKLDTPIGNSYACSAATTPGACDGGCYSPSDMGACAGGTNTLCTDVVLGPQATCVATNDDTGKACAWTPTVCTARMLVTPFGNTGPTCTNGGTKATCNGGCTWMWASQACTSATVLMHSAPTCAVKAVATPKPATKHVCSNRGVCDASTGLCGCFEGYAGDDCALQSIYF